MKDCFSPIESTNELIKFVTDHTGLYRCKLMNHSCHEKHDKVAKKIFGFQSFDKTMNCIKAFFQEVPIGYPKLCYEDKKISSSLRI